ncbi:tetratricopeptide repeat protein [uncultured Methanobrevibacter sp.]|uniref:tetratricopeptide repeat protein n=1 Tax=uncultured Methanobrevibacter sp. TaxID=253161 RepID=UPI00260EB66F|nr:CDC27 family protein [uncultured Methanobrevibacter sp.]
MNLIISTLIEANKLLNIKDYYKALDCFECVLNINPTNNLATLGKTICIYHLNLIGNHELITKYEEALDNYLKLVELYEHGKYKKTLKKCDELLKQNKNNFSVLAIKFSAQFELTQYNEALTTCDKLLELDPDDIIVIYAKATTLYKLNIYNEAIECYDKILNVTNNFDALFFKTASLLILSKYEEALKCCNNLLKLQPENSDANGLKQLIKYKIAQR